MNTTRTLDRFHARKSLLAIAIASAAALPSPASATDYTWSGGTSTTWSNNANWDTTAPNTAGTAVFSNASPTNQPTVTASTSIDGITLTVNPQITINSSQTLTVTNATGTTGNAGITLKGAGNLLFTATGTNLNFGAGTITIDGGGFGLSGSTLSVSATTGLPTPTTTDRSLLNDISVTANGGRIGLNQGSGTNGTSYVFNTLSLGGPLTTFSSAGGNSGGISFAGTVTLLQDATRTLRITNSTSHNGNDWISGKITDGTGTAANPLRLATTNRTFQIFNATNDYAGGTIVEAGGTGTGSYIDVTANGTLGTGNLSVQSGGRVRLDNATSSGTAGNLASTATIAADAGSAVGIGINASNASRFTSTSAGVYGIDLVTHNYALDMSALGNGRMFLGSVTGGTYSGTSLTAGADSTYRLGGGNASGNLVNFFISGANALTGNNKIVVGSGLNTNASYGRTIISASQNSIGSVIVNTDGLLSTAVNGGTPFGNTANTIDVYGTLAASGANGVFNTSILGNIALHPGSSLTFDNQNFGNSSGGNNTNRWDDSTALPTLNGANFTLTAARSADSSESVGAIAFNGNSSITLNGAANSAGNSQLAAASLTRQAASRGVMTLAAQGTLGTTGAGNSRFSLTSAPTPANGIVDPWIIRSTGDFLNYTASGYVLATYSANTINTAAATDVITQAAVALSTNPTVYALKLTGSLTTSVGNTTVTIGSGTTPAGLILTANGPTHTAIFDFAAREALIWKTTGNPDVFSGGIKTSGGLTKAGTASITLSSTNATNQSISGGVVIQAGTLTIGSTVAAADMSDNLFTVNNAGTFNINDKDVTIAGLTGTGSSGNITNSSANVRTLTINLAAGSQTYEGRLQGTNTAANLNLVKSGDGTQVLAGVSSYAGTTTVTAGTLEVTGKINNTSGLTVQDTATANFTSGIQNAAATVTIAAGGKVAMKETAGTLSSGWPGGSNAAISVIGGLSLTGTAKLDLFNNDVVINTTGNDMVTYNTIEDAVRTGYASGAWNGNGINSTTAGQLNYFTLLVLNTAETDPNAVPAYDLTGLGVGTDAIVVKFTHQDDLNGDGLITAADKSIFTSHWSDGATGATHRFGDMDFDGTYTFNDVQLFNLYYNTALPSLPEPTSLTLLTLSASALLLRRRK